VAYLDQLSRSKQPVRRSVKGHDQPNVARWAIDSSTPKLAISATLTRRVPLRGTSTSEKRTERVGIPIFIAGRVEMTLCERDGIDQPQSLVLDVAVNRPHHHVAGRVGGRDEIFSLGAGLGRAAARI
jgi:hypothetical protein